MPKCFSEGVLTEKCEGPLVEIPLLGYSIHLCPSCLKWFKNDEGLES